MKLYFQSTFPALAPSVIDEYENYTNEFIEFEMTHGLYDNICTKPLGRRHRKQDGEI